MTIKSYSATHGNYAVTIDNYVVDNSTGKVVYINGGKIVKNDITSTFALGNTPSLFGNIPDGELIPALRTNINPSSEFAAVNTVIAAVLTDIEETVE